MRRESVTGQLRRKYFNRVLEMMSALRKVPHFYPLPSGRGCTAGDMGNTLIRQHG